MMSSDGGSGKEQDFELNLASIIDCFTVLITYLLVSASFITLGVLDVTVAASTTTEAALPPELSITIKLDSDGNIHINTTGKETNDIALNAKNGSVDLDSVITQLHTFKDRFPNLNSAMVTATDSVKYKDLVMTIEKTKAILPAVAISAELETP